MIKNLTLSSAFKSPNLECDYNVVILSIIRNSTHPLVIRFVEKKRIYKKEFPDLLECLAVFKKKLAKRIN